jgi:hypothetical protein
MQHFNHATKHLEKLMEASTDSEGEMDCALVACGALDVVAQILLCGKVPLIKQAMELLVHLVAPNMFHPDGYGNIIGNWVWRQLKPFCHNHFVHFIVELLPRFEKIEETAQLVEKLDFPGTERVAFQGISLLIHTNSLVEAHQEYVKEMMSYHRGSISVQFKGLTYFQGIGQLIQLGPATLQSIQAVALWHHDNCMLNVLVVEIHDQQTGVQSQ